MIPNDTAYLGLASYLRFGISITDLPLHPGVTACLPFHTPIPAHISQPEFLKATAVPKLMLLLLIAQYFRAE